MLKIEKFKKTYPGNTEPVLSINNFEIDTGIFWIKGENGAGKTSLLKSIAGLIPFEGSISVDGHEINRHRMSYTKIVNYAEAEPKYPPFLTGEELIGFYKATKLGNFPALLSEQLGVEKFKHQKTGTYSSGMLKKLSLLLAFTGKPHLVLLDEPLVALDLAAVDTLKTAIRKYYEDGVSFLITSHQHLDSMLIGNPVTLLLKNRSLQQEAI